MEECSSSSGGSSSIENSNSDSQHLEAGYLAAGLLWPKAGTVVCVCVQVCECVLQGPEYRVSFRGVFCGSLA